MNIKEKTIWLASLLEGEGCFVFAGKDGKMPRIILIMNGYRQPKMNLMALLEAAE